MAEITSEEAVYEVYDQNRTLVSYEIDYTEAVQKASDNQGFVVEGILVYDSLNEMD